MPLLSCSQSFSLSVS